MVKFLSCDWGTSAFRLRLIDAKTLTILAEISSDNGIAAAYAKWGETGKTDQEERFLFYLDFIRDYIGKIERAQNLSLQGVPLILSGMASSSIGMDDLPYRHLPFAIDGSDAVIRYFEERAAFHHPVLLISGVKSDDDVMRGEETQLVGCAIDYDEEEIVYIFPGTHSKHIHVKRKQVIGFKTYMTGEYFELLSKKSILSAGIERSQDLQSIDDPLQGFKKGVQAAIETNLLHTSFMVRTNTLFAKLSKKENLNYLSGLLIGTELQELLLLTDAQICLCAGSHLKSRYEIAFQVLGLHDKVRILSTKQADEAVIRGQSMIYNQFKNKG